MAEVVDLGERKGGRPKGLPKTGGRKKGTPNRATKELKEVARKYTARALRELARLAEKSEDEAVRLKACAELLDRGHGKPTTHAVVGGDGGHPIQRQQLIVNASERVAAQFAEVIDADDPAESLTDDSLRAVQAISFVTAAKEAQVRPPEARSSKAGGIKNLASAPAEPEPANQFGSDAGPVNPEPQPPEPGATITLMDSGLRIVCLKPDRPDLPPVFALHGSAGLMRRGNWETILDSARKHAGGDDLGPVVVQKPQQQIQPSRPDQRPFARRP